MATIHPLESAKGKIDRAKEHLDALNASIKAFADHPRRIIQKDDLAGGLHTIEFIFPEIDFRIAHIVGDVTYCLRASLDHVAWALAFEGLKRAKFPPKYIKFPICEKWDTQNVSSFNKSVKHIPVPAVKIIESLQPYNAGDAYRDSLLWQLNALCNTDKHRHVTVDTSSLHVYFPKLPIKFQAQIKPLDYGNDRHVIAVPLALKDKMQFDPNATIGVTFGDFLTGTSITVSRLRQIHNFIGDKVIPRFTRFFSQPVVINPSVAVHSSLPGGMRP